MTGQSLSVAGNSAYPSAEPYAGDLTFSSGIMAGVGTTNSFVPMPKIGPAQVLWEAMNQYKFLLTGDAAYNDDYSLLASAHGRNGQPLSAISKGSEAFADGQFQIAEGARLAKAASRTSLVQALCFLQGEADFATDVSTYKAQLVRLLNDYRVGITASTGQTSPISLFSYQCASEQYQWERGVEYEPHTAAAINQLTRDTDDILCFAPTYHLDYSDGVHLIGDSYQHLGQHLGRVLYSVVYRGERWTGLRPRTIRWDGASTVRAVFDVPVAPLVFRTDRVTDPGDNGFVVRDGRGAVAIRSMQITGSDTVDIVLDRPLQGSATLAYAWYSVGGQLAGRTTGPRGCLFDSDPTRPAHRDSSLANPCVRFKELITA
ncbi:hypothetical protein [Sphingomonas sp.]|uniref:hypothetical protein n=1 Tax=Sphingomonas sp. TaxID=28214 RepID=UPI000DBBD6FC|nr:hypothetical protein [Sphingomonas sp.]PZT91651.1 MAG: hypothetical protein DI625_15100 [Sphingomonas sp.]